MGARWYLACTAMLSLLCVAMHLSIQEHAQTKAERLIQEWGNATGIEVAGVHYHLLRNALILKEIGISRGEEKISISHMLLRANPRLLTGPNPQIGRVEIAGLEAAVSLDGISETWGEDERLQRIWQTSRYLSLDNGIVTLFSKDETRQPLTFAGLSLRQRSQGQRRTITATAQLATGDLHWQWQSGEQGGVGAGGKMGWRQIDAGLIAAALGLRPVAGELQGHLSWGAAQKEDTGQKPYDIEGRVTFITGQGRPDGSLRWQAAKRPDNWQVDLSATDWPVDAWIDSLPRIANRSLYSGDLTGSLLWQGSSEKWKLSGTQGELRNVVYADTDASDVPPWHWQRLAYENLQLAPAERRLTAAGMRLAGAEIVLTPQSQPARQNTAAAEPGWTAVIDNMQAEGLTLALQLERGRVETPTLQGSGSLKADGQLTFDLNSSSADAPEGGESADREPPQWRLNGYATKHQGVPAEARFDLLARHVPVHRLRPLIPLEAASGKPLALEGDVAELHLAVEVTDGLWQAKGEAVVAALRLAHAGDILETDQLAVQFGPVGMGLPSQRVSQLDVRGWRYLTVLNPLPPLQPGEEVRQERVRQQPPWWTTMLRRQNWSVETSIWLDGSISVGHADSRWAEGLDLQLNHLQAGQWADIQMRGRVGDGEFALNGDWDALSLPSRFKGEASLTHALPFFLRNWMNISGMPSPLRGRLSARLTVAEGETPNDYQASASIGLKRGLTRLGVFPSDPLLSRIGYNTNDALMLLADTRGDAELTFAASGDWRDSPLTMERLGRAMQSALQQRIKAREQRKHSPMRDTSGETLLRVQVRLHDEESLSLNERARLHKALSVLRSGSSRVIDLVPRWAGAKLDAELLGRIKKTQHLIEQYLTYRGVSKGRIFPLWPTAENQVKEIGSISLVVRQTRQPSPE